MPYIYQCFTKIKAKSENFIERIGDFSRGVATLKLHPILNATLPPLLPPTIYVLYLMLKQNTTVLKFCSSSLKP